MNQFQQINILDALEMYGVDKLSETLSTFRCPINQDIENYIKHQAIPFAQQRISITYLIFNTGNPISLLGYFTLTNKFVSINKNLLSKTFQKRILKFSQYDSQSERYFLSMPLIAQLGKNYSFNIQAKLEGTHLLKMACDKTQAIQHMIGGKSIYIECNNNPKLYDFYSSFNFIPFGQRPSSHIDPENQVPLIQMIKYFKG